MHTGANVIGHRSSPLHGLSRASRRLAGVLPALALCAALAACGGGENESSAGAEDAATGAQSASDSPLVWNECPIDLATVNAITGLELSNEDSACSFRDGVRVVSINVLGASLDPRQDYERQGFAITDIDRGDYGFVGTKETEAQAYVVVGDLSLRIGLLSFALDPAGYRTLALELIDASLKR